MLDAFGVGAEAQAVYQAMLECPTLDVGGIACETGLPVERVRQELDVLAELLLVTPDPGDQRFQARPPDIAVEGLISREEAALRERRRHVIAARETVGSLVDAFVAGRTRRDPEGLVELMDDAGAATSRLSQLVRAAREGVAYLLPGEARSAGGAEVSLRLNEDILDRGLTVRTVMPQSVLTVGPLKDRLLSQMEHGLQARWHPSPAAWIVVIDDVCAVSRRRGGGGGTVLHGAELVAPLRALFDQTWHESLPIVPADTDSSVVQASDPRVRQVVTLLAQGHKDQAIARRLGLSARTVRRLVSVVIEELHADSRFQAGVLAVKRGWVS